MIEPPKLRHKDVWTCRYLNLTVEINHFQGNGDHPNWTYYVYIPERFTSRFDEIWLDDKFERFSPESPEHVTHDYLRSILSNVEWHCGITYYAKHGQVKGHRVIQAGCDYDHLWDRENGYPISLAPVLNDAMQTVRELVALLNIKQESV